MIQADQPPTTSYEIGNNYSLFGPKYFTEQRIDSRYYNEKFPSLKPPRLEDLTKGFSLAGRGSLEKEKRGSVLIDSRTDIGEFFTPGYRDDLQVVAEAGKNALNAEYFNGSGGRKFSAAGLLRLGKGLCINPKMLYDLDGGGISGKELRLLGKISKNLEFSGGYFDDDGETGGKEGYFLVAQGKENYKGWDFGGGIELVDGNGNNEIDPKLGGYGWLGRGDYLIGFLADDEEKRLVLGDYEGDFGFRLRGIKNGDGYQRLQLITAKNPNLQFDRDFLNPLKNEAMRGRYGNLGFETKYHPWRYKKYFPSQVSEKGVLMYMDWEKLPDETKKLACGGIIRVGDIHALDFALRRTMRKGGESESRIALGWETEFKDGPMAGWGFFLEGLYNTEKRKVDDVFIYVAKRIEF